jgi:DMSO/TMAO reductase YedYZ molybdopterin-dependent catalytic subunit
MKKLFRALQLGAGAVLVSLAFATASERACAADAPPAGVAIDGQVQTVQHLTVQDLQKLPSTSVTVNYVTGHGTETGTYTGALLWTLLNNAVLVNGPAKGAVLRHVVTVTGRDGYAVILSAGELSPDFEGKSVILAFAKDGQPLTPEDGLRLIVPGDKHGGRAVHDVVVIHVQ